MHPRGGNAVDSLYRAKRVAIAVIALPGILASACGGGGGGGSAEPTLSLSTNSLSFSASGPNGSTPLSQTVSATVTGGSSGALYILVQKSGPAVASITNVFVTGPTTGQATVNPASPASLGVGAFSSTITVTACLNDPTCATGRLAGSPQTVNVTYSISGVAASAASLSYTIGNTVAPADLIRQVTVTGNPSQAWSASSTAPWLSVTPVVGDTGAPVQVTASLVGGQVDAMSNGTYTDSIAITPATVGSTLTIPVTLTIDRTQVTYVAPYVAFSGTSAEVVIRGDNLSQIVVQDVKFGSSSATAFNVVSDTEVRAVHPALPTGTYPVQLQNDAGLDRSLAKLVVIDAPVYSPTTLAYPAPGGQGLTAFAYDAERRALVVGTRSGTLAPSVLLRYQFSAGAWGAPTQVDVPGIRSIVLSPDGSLWLAGTEPTFDVIAKPAAIVQIDATDLHTIGATSTGLITAAGGFINGLAAANDGNVLAVLATPASSTPESLRYKIQNPGFSPLGVAAHGDAGANGDGSRVIFGSDPGGDVFFYDASSGTVSPTGINFFVRTPPALSRTGLRLVLNGDVNFLTTQRTRVYDASFNALGDLSLGTLAAVISPDGSRAYTYTSGKLKIFDLSGPPPGSGVLYPEIGVPGITLAGDPGINNVRMTISPDGGTVFLAGETQIVIQPVP